MSTKQVGATPALADQLKDPAFSAYFALRTVFTIAPIVMGLDKFFNLLTHPHHWSMYLAGWIDDWCPGRPISACIWWASSRSSPGCWWRWPRGWAPGWSRHGCGIIINLVTGPGFYDVALRDFGLFVGAVALARLAQGVHSGTVGVAAVSGHTARR